jgi:hypothetical protein
MAVAISPKLNIDLRHPEVLSLGRDGLPAVLL